MKKYITLDNLKQKNVSDILSYIMEKRKTYRREIQKETGFSWGTISTTVAQLIEKGYVKEIIGDERAGAGRRTGFLCLNGEKIVGLGIDVNRTAVEAIITSFDGNVVFSKTYPFTANSLGQVIGLMETVIDELVLRCAGKYEIKSLGISFQGKVDGEKGISFAFPGIEDWGVFNVKEYFSNKYDLPVYFEHDPKCMLYSVKLSQKAEDVLLIRADDGIGLSVMQKGKIMEDEKRLEFGHIIFSLNSNFCKRENLEYYSSASGISKRAGLPFEQIKNSLSQHKRLFDEATDYLALSIYNLFVLFCPEKIILTGELFKIELYKNMLKDKLKRLIGENCVDILTDLGLSAAKGVALNALKFNVKNKI